MGLFRKVQFHLIQNPQLRIPQPHPFHVGRTVLPSALNKYHSLSQTLPHNRRSSPK